MVIFHTRRYYDLSSTDGLLRATQNYTQFRTGTRMKAVQKFANKRRLCRLANYQRQSRTRRSNIKRLGINKDLLKYRCFYMKKSISIVDIFNSIHQKSILFWSINFSFFFYHSYSNCFMNI